MRRSAAASRLWSSTSLSSKPCESRLCPKLESLNPSHRRSLGYTALPLAHPRVIALLSVL